MQKNKFRGIFLTTLVFVLNTASHAQDGVQTVEALLEAENKAVLEKLKLSNEALAPPRVQTEKKVVKTGPATLNVKSVYGLSNSVRADLVYEGQPFFGLIKGGKVGPCSVEDIRGACVSLIPSGSAGAGVNLALSPGESLADKKAEGKLSHPSKSARKKADNRVVAANMCPSACWSPPRPVLTMNSGESLGVFPSANDAPRFSPPVLTGNQRTLTPLITPTQGVGPAVTPTQPTAVAPRPVGSLRMSTTLSGSGN